MKFIKLCNYGNKNKKGKQNEIPTIKENKVLFVIQFPINHIYYVNIKFLTFVPLMLSYILTIRFIHKT